MNISQILKNYFFLGLSILFWSSSFAQIDSVTFRIEGAGAAATEGYLPLWIVSNRFGVLEEDGADGYLRVGAAIPFQKDKKFSYALGLDLLSTDK